MDPDTRSFAELSKEELLGLLQDAAKNWLAHDGLWFQAVEKTHGLDEAIRLDGETWAHFSRIEAKRIMDRLGLPPGGGIPALVRALGFRLYAHLNEAETVEVTPSRCVFRMKTCRVQDSRKRKGLPDFPCKAVGLIEFSGFAEAIDPRIRTRCVSCPPDRADGSCWCSWEFTLALT
ncbi:MAG: hypothetical protein A2X36_01250 [Elusimicrobia bacterium GWA2_69_24]|nr:MAG: hypothetical protein A2X36_01250 [Elusimicrobia bacterium GWA2_69_24]HBL16491.1 hypothetical protein [Elusimicrobiota bacterium]